ncbi:MAG: choice-of-anchor J domain-containing protein [Chloroflexota bacterium]
MEAPANNQNGNKTVLIAIGIIIAVCCACVVIAAALGVIVYERGTQYISTSIPNFPTIVPSDFGTPTAEPEVTRPPVEESTNETLLTLGNAVVPENDPYDLACRLQGTCNVPETLDPPAAPLEVGATQKFWIANSNTNEHFQIEATLLYITPHTYFWAENGTDVDMNDLKRLMDTFEEKIYPTDREFFGSEWTPGVDGDEHIYVVYASNIGYTVAGYFSPSDSYNPKVSEYSNGHEMYVLGTSQDLGDDYTYSTLAHEFVHMIQFASDRNDVSWINEGFAELGAFLNGYDVGGADWLYAQDPDLQLNDWADSNSPDFAPHYGASFLYLLYYLDRFGEDASKALTDNPENDLTSVDSTLADLNITDTATGKVVTADDVFMDWALAMFINDKSVGDGRYTFHNYPDVPQTRATETVSTCPSAPLARSVHQYGIDYISIDCAGEMTLHFEGSTVTGLLPVEANSGQYAFWSNRGDESNMTLTREFDFTNASGPIELSYSTWYDIEEDWDYLYVEVSEDGQNWTILKTPSGTDTDPTGNSYGWGYTGKTSGWIEETVDLSAYAGKKVQVRFDYVTDAAVNGEGLLVDDIKIDAINYTTDFESDDGGWEARGFVRVNNVLPQTFRLALIIKRGGETTVQYIDVNADQTADIPLSLESGDTVTLVVTGTTRFTRTTATYSVEIR